ncbi:MAG TPA: hypothetical protein VN985_03220 [Candidatus Eisenbacteria bacterium]|nr:hypothetical protein [Candidatus Eisenbacteria bacterium]
MRKLVRAPLTWMIVAECVVVGTLLLVAWHVIAGVAAPGHAAPLSFPAVEASPADAALPSAGATSAGANTHGPPPGLNVGFAFWRLRLASLNRDQAELEAMEWRITHAVMEAAHDYLETVVLPAVRHAEGGG